ncbi:MAG: ATP-binding protein [Clostridia bacterium]|nr:ATP-binding protein [Clostridia bacterium]
MRKKIFASIAISSALILLLSVVFIVNSLKSSFSKTLEEEIRNETIYIANGCEKSASYPLDSGITYLHSISDNSRRITLISPDGTVVFDNSVEDLSTMENHSEREEFIEAQTQDFGISTRKSSTLSQNTIYYAKRLSNGYVIRISAEEYSVLSTAGMLAGVIVLIVVIGAFVAIVFAKFSAYNIVKPINEINLESFDEKNIVYDELRPFYAKISSQKRTIKKHLESANEKQREFSLITGNMAEGLILLDKSAYVLSCNRSALSMLGAIDDISGKNILNLKNASRFYDAIISALKGLHTEKSCSVLSKTLNIISSPVMTNHRVAGAVIIILDITEKAEREALRREFSANVSHELKTPLTSISGFAELMKNGLVLPSDIPDFASRIYDESSRLISLVNDILHISALDENNKIYEFKSCDLSAIAAEVQRALEHTASKNDVSFLLKSDGKCEISGVHDMLFEIIYNLCDNAIKYNKKGGYVEVSVDKTASEVVLKVKDNGIGIPKEDTDRVFERFYRVDKSHSKHIGGTGLGLSIVKHAVSFNKGKLSIDSELDVGTTVTVLFPLQK